MPPSASTSSRHIGTRLICALLAVGGLVAIVVAVVTWWRTRELPGIVELATWVSALGCTYIFGRYAIERPGNGERGLMAEPSERVRQLAMRPGSKVEGIKAYREETGLDLKRAMDVVERLASQRPLEPDPSIRWTDGNRSSRT